MAEVACTIYNWDEAKKALYQSERPVGIIVICADNSVKNKFVYGTLERTVDMVCLTSGSCTVDRLRRVVKRFSTICVSLTPEETHNHAKRHELVTKLRKYGCKQVYAVYLRITAAIFQETQPIIRALEANPPTVDGLDGLIVL